MSALEILIGVGFLIFSIVGAAYGALLILSYIENYEDFDEYDD